MGRGWTLFVLGWALVLGGGFLAHVIQTADGVRVEDVRFAGADGTPMSGLLYIPPTATPETPAPGVLAVHGYINSRETQDGFSIEFARRGYVVLAIDQTGHGYSGGGMGANGYGGPDGLRYLRSLAMVDPDQIGLEGHSMGGWAVLAAAMAQPSAYRAMVLEGSATGVRLPPAGVLASAPGTPQFPKNLAVVYSRWDEFAPLMWEVPRAADVGRSAKLIALFGAAGPVVPGRVYGSMAAGDARALYTPATTHPGDHLSTEAIGDAVDWFARTLKGGTPRPADDQIWMWKEIGTLIAFVGVVILMLGAFDLYLGLPTFAALAGAPEPARERRGAGWWAMLAATALVPVVSFYPFMLLGMVAAGPSRAFPQPITNQLMVWALLNAAVTVLASVLLKGPKPRFNLRWGGAAGIALLTVATGYLALLVADFAFKVDFRFWVVALKLLSPRQFGWFLVYLVPFTAYFVVALGSLHANLAVRGDSPARQYATGLAALAGGFALFVLAQYAPLLLTGRLPIPAEALNAIISIPFLPLMAIVALVAVFTWRRTNSYLPGAFVCGLFVTWYIVAGTAAQVAG
ncbi:MAG: alpha/beta fold hydrolase [Caulobacteraceae bacterium]|nr:alpha/beta fold hydrolase [Caulobacteraceae bacterium]